MEKTQGTTSVSDIPNLPDVQDVPPMPDVKPTKPERPYVQYSLNDQPPVKRSFADEPPVRVDQSVFQAPVLPNSSQGDILKMAGHFFVKMGKVWPMILDVLPPGFAPRWIITDDGGVYHQLDNGEIVQENFPLNAQIGEQIEINGVKYSFTPDGWLEIRKFDPDHLVLPLDAKVGQMHEMPDGSKRVFRDGGWHEVLEHGVQPDKTWPRNDGQQFLTGDIQSWVPPRPGSDENKRQLALRSVIQQGQSRFDMNTAIHLLSEEVERKKIDGVPESDLVRDPAIIGLAALKRTKQEIQQKKHKRVLRGTLLLLILVAIVTGAVFWAIQNVTRGHYTVPSACKVPFGDSEITGNRYRTYSYQELFGYRLTGDDSIVSERTEIKLPGETLTILGFDEAKGKWWRQNYAKGEFGTPMLKPTDKYWFVGEKTKTALVTYNNFCN